LTSSWGMILPSATAFRPASIFCFT
jgi:hypothetical protein